MKKKVTRSKPKNDLDLVSVITKLKDELATMKTRHNELVEYIAGIEQAKKRVNENGGDKEEGLMDKKVGSASLADIVTIARAWMEQNRIDNSQASNPDSYFADVGKTAFSSWMESAFGKNFKTSSQENSGVQ